MQVYGDAHCAVPVGMTPERTRSTLVAESLRPSGLEATIVM